MVKRGQGRGKEKEWQNHMKQQKGMERRMKQCQRHISNPWLCCLTPPLPASQRSVLWHSLQEAVGSQPRAGPDPQCSTLSSAGRLEAARYTFAGPRRASISPVPEETQLCSKQRQSDCRAGWEAGCSNPRQVQLRACLYTPTGSKDPEVSPFLVAPPGSSSRLQTCSPYLTDSWRFPLDLEPYDSPKARMTLAQQGSGFRSVKLS